jgi:hypothetical protein
MLDGTFAFQPRHTRIVRSTTNPLPIPCPATKKQHSPPKHHQSGIAHSIGQGRSKLRLLAAGRLYRGEHGAIPNPFGLPPPCPVDFGCFEPWPLIHPLNHMRWIDSKNA